MHNANIHPTLIQPHECITYSIRLPARAFYWERSFAKLPEGAQETEHHQTSKRVVQQLAHRHGAWLTHLAATWSPVSPVNNLMITIGLNFLFYSQVPVNYFVVPARDDTRDSRLQPRGGQQAIMAGT